MIEEEGEIEIEEDLATNTVIKSINNEIDRERKPLGLTLTLT